MSGTITFADEFDTLSLHRSWQQGDKWQLIAPGSTDGRGGPYWGEGGSQWWVNPYNPNTPINDIYAVSNGMLNVSLLPTPSRYQSYIDQQAGAHMPYVGGLLNNSPTNYQHYGYWEMGMSCDRVPGFSCEISLENVQITGHWPPQINIGVSTDGSGKQTLQAHMYYGSTSRDYSQPIDGTQQHSYGVDWEADYITFYFDKANIFQVPNPGGLYKTDNMFAYLYTGANYSAGTGVNPPVNSLPAYAHIDYFRVYDGAPAVPTPAPTPTPSSGDTLTLNLSEDAYLGDAQARITIDGLVLADAQFVTALHSQGQTGAFVFRGDFGAGAHTVGVSFLNDAWGGSPTTDRNLYLDNMTYNGTPVAGATHSFYSNGASTFTVGGTAPPPPTGGLTVHLSEDAWMGDAQFQLTLDGKALGTGGTVTALHSAGKLQDFAFSGIAAGPHQLGVTFTNDAWGGTDATDRNLYVGSIDYAGHSTPGATLLINGTHTFAIG